MRNVHQIRSIRAAVLALAVGLFLSAGSSAADTHTSGPFKGPKANTGMVTHSKHGDKNVLTLSDDFKAPETPDPHWQVVDSQGNIYLLQKLMIKGGKVNKSIILPSYIHDVAKVQIWCAFAETNLGEAAFESPVM
jgi:ABC-type glycerol-3-phosphate transport system substrate-binding protein